jgi:hypothetical protein
MGRVARAVNDLDIYVTVDNNGTLSSYWGNAYYGNNTRFVTPPPQHCGNVYLTLTPLN